MPGGPTLLPAFFFPDVPLMWRPQSRLREPALSVEAPFLRAPVAAQLSTAQLNASLSGQYNQGPLDELSPTHFRYYFSLSPIQSISSF
eukprot:scaffold119962_cov81-Attheya_sp.AAC.5